MKPAFDPGKLSTPIEITDRGILAYRREENIHPARPSLHDVNSERLERLAFACSLVPNACIDRLERLERFEQLEPTAS